MEIAKEVKRRYEELVAIRDNAIAEIKPLEAYLKASGFLDAPAEKPKRTRRRKNEPPVQPEA